MVADRLTKVTQYKPTMTKLEATKLFFTNIFMNYGLPQKITYERDRKLMSEFEKKLHKLCGTKTIISYA